MSTRAARGVTLVELVVFIVIVGVGMAGLFAAFNTITAASADPQVRKQVLAIAESLMQEIQLMPFTYCDPDDPAASTATGTGDCGAGMIEGIGTEGGVETRYNVALPYDNVSDYHGFSMDPPTTGGIRDITNNVVTGLENYTASVTVAQAGLGASPNEIASGSGAALRISVQVTGPSGVSITLEGYRTRYAPKAVP